MALNLMYIIYNQDGSIKEKNFPNYVNQGSSNVNRIFVAIDGEDNTDYSVSGVFKLPNNDVSSVAFLQGSEKLHEDDEENTSGYYYDLTEAQTYYAGIVLLSINAIYTLTQNLFTYTAKITVNSTTYQPETDDSDITNAQYNSLIAALNQKESKAQIDAQLPALVNGWLVSHPEATTTVEDGAITKVKLNSSLISSLFFKVSNLTELTQALANGEKFIVFADDVEITLSSTLTIPEGTTILGNRAKFTRATGFENYLLSLTHNCEVSNLLIDGNRTNMVNPTWDKTVEIYLGTGNNYIHDIEVVNGNEGVMVHGNFNKIEHCKLTNCGGNAIHFTGGDYTVVDGCYVNGANKKLGMGHEDGCIIWSNECHYITCINNHCEDGKTGFGSIDTHDNSNVKLVNNTIKNCINAIDMSTSSDPATNVLIEGNFIIDSNAIDINKTALGITSQARFIISKNILINSYIGINRYSGILIDGNLIMNGYIHCGRSTNIRISNNIINNYFDVNSTYDGIVGGYCYNITIDNNYVRSNYEVINFYASNDVNISNNTIRAYSVDTTKYALSHAFTFNNNDVVSYTNGVVNGSSESANMNTIYIKTETNYSLRQYGGTTNAICCMNRINGNYRLDSDESNQNANNIVNASSTSVFVDVVNDLTNITTSGYDSVISGDDYVAILTADEGYDLPDEITITVDSQDADGYEYIYEKDTGKLIVFGVVSELTITAVGVAQQ